MNDWLVEKRKNQLHRLLNAVLKNFDEMLWIDEGRAAQGEAWNGSGRNFLHFAWTYPQIEVILKDKNANVIISWEPELNSAAWRKARNIIDRMPCRSTEINQVLDALMHELKALKAN